VLAVEGLYRPGVGSRSGHAFRPEAESGRRGRRGARTGR
jgi:hypothetical protein